MPALEPGVQAPDFSVKPSSLLLGDLNYHYTREILANIFLRMGFQAAFLDAECFPRDILAIGSPATQVTVPATVTVDGINAEVFFAGLTPGGIGLYQINFRVPTSVKAGNVKVQVIQGPSSSNVTTLPVVP